MSSVAIFAIVWGAGWLLTCVGISAVGARYDDVDVLMGFVVALMAWPLLVVYGLGHVRLPKRGVRPSRRARRALADAQARLAAAQALAERERLLGLTTTQED